MILFVNISKIINFIFVSAIKISPNMYVYSDQCNLVFCSRWYTSGRDDGDNVWVWDTGNTMFTDIDALFIPFQNMSYERFAAYK